MDEKRGLWRGKVEDEIHADHNGEWIEGDLLCDKMSDGYISYGIASREFENIKVYLVDTSTLGECTGLRDKNGKLIFEGDFLKGKYNFIYTVVWDTECAGFYPFVIKEGKIYEVASKTMEVIGNIHDNPQFLNGGETK